MYPKLFNNFEPQIRQAIGTYLKDLTNTQLLALTAAVTTADIKVQGDEALVTIPDPKHNRTFRFTMRRSATDGVWQVVALNYNDFKQLLKKEFLGFSPHKDNV